ncbi:MAG TPA: hypothetical protein VMN79_01265 [Casimicrobiaceae bacterium]|nr:hypothetical protein [Casimicrobiaceae bacterium]
MKNPSRPLASRPPQPFATALLAAARAAADVLLAHVHDTLSFLREVRPEDDVASMSVHLRRDIGVEAALSLHPAELRRLPDPRF